MIDDSKSVLKEVCRAYLKFKKFRCKGVLNRTIRSSAEISTRFEMQLCYAKPRRLYLEWWNCDRPREKHIIISTPSSTIRHFASEYKWEKENSIEHALAGEAGISSGLALAIPSLLVGNKDYHLLETELEVKKLAESKLGKVFKINGIGRNSINRSIVACAENGLIYSIQESYTIPTGIVECKSEYSDFDFA